MEAELKEKVNKKHIGRNEQSLRMHLGITLETLAAELGISQQEVLKIENQEEIEEELLSQIADVLGVSAEVIRDFDVEKAIYNINHHNYQDATISEGATTFAITQQINPIGKIVELYERLLQSEKERIELLKK